MLLWQNQEWEPIVPLLPHLPMSSLLTEPQEAEDPCTEIQTASSLVISKEHFTIWDWWLSPRLVQSPLKPLGVCACQNLPLSPVCLGASPLQAQTPLGNGKQNWLNNKWTLPAFWTSLHKSFVALEPYPKNTWMRKVFTFNLIWLNSN